MAYFKWSFSFLYNSHFFRSLQNNSLKTKIKGFCIKLYFDFRTIFPLLLLFTIDSFTISSNSISSLWTVDSLRKTLWMLRTRLLYQVIFFFSDLIYLMLYIHNSLEIIKKFHPSLIVYCFCARSEKDDLVSQIRNIC